MKTKSDLIIYKKKTRIKSGVLCDNVIETRWNVSLISLYLYAIVGDSVQNSVELSYKNYMNVYRKNEREIPCFFL